MTDLTWQQVSQRALDGLIQRGLNGPYEERLKFEIAEVEKQGAELVWVNYAAAHKRFPSNPNNLVLPWVLGMVDDDPIAARKTPMLNTVRAAKVLEFKAQNGYVPHDLLKDPDSPDIDIDCLPAARDPLKAYAIQQYGQNFDDGYGSVCSVGTWQTFKFKSALIDSAVAIGYMERGTQQNSNGKKKTGRPGVGDAAVAVGAETSRLEKAEQFTKLLPDDVDDMKEGGLSACKAIDKDTGKECKAKYGGKIGELRCPKCGAEDTDGPTFAKVYAEHQTLRDFHAACKRRQEELQKKWDEKRAEDPNLAERVYPDIFDIALNLIGRIRNMGMHAGAIIITDRPLYGNVPMAKTGSKGFWTSMWTEGRNTQLSKFGYIKWDLLGLKTLEYIFKACQLIEENRGISFGKNMEGMEYNNPRLRHAGFYFDGEGKRHYINMDDPDALRLANEQKTDGVFQFDTELAKSILSNQSYCFEDLMLFNAMGHPGPMASIPDAVKNRDDGRKSWQKRLHPTILDVLKDTYGVIVYQEQLQAIWQRVAGLTAPEAQEARKAVAKKHTHKLKPIKEKWLRGAAKMLGEQEAADWWPKMETFGRYAFNKSHAVSYCLVALKCLWLKAHFAPEFWAAVMSDCHPDKLVRYMGVARAEEWRPTAITYCGKYKGEEEKPRSVRFSVVNIENMTRNFTVTGDTVNQGLIGIKGLGKKAALSFEGKGKYTDIDQFVQSAPGRQSKTVLERFIKLGAFRFLPGHENANALWHYYMYKYCKSGKNMTELRREVRAELLALEGWTPKAVNEERARQISEWKRQFPKRSKVPDKFKNWNPKPVDTRDKVMALPRFANDFTIEERLAFQKQFLGYWIDSPLDMYKCEGITIAMAKENAKTGNEVKIEGIIVDSNLAETKKGDPYLRLYVTDGIQTALIFIWSRELAIQDDKLLNRKGAAVQLFVDYDEKRGTFSLARGEIIMALRER